MKTEIKLLTKSNRWSCTLLAFCMASGFDPDFMLDVIGHDGSKIVDPYMEEPYGRKGFHAQEIIPLLISNQIACTPFELSPVSLVGNEYIFIATESRLRVFDQIVANSRGVLIGDKHAVAFDKGTIYDSEGSIYPYRGVVEHANDLQFKTVWMLTPYEG